MDDVSCFLLFRTHPNDLLVPSPYDIGFDTVQRNTIVKMYSKEKAALYLFGRDRNKLEGTAVNNDDLAIIGTSDRNHDEGGPKGTISTESTSLSTPSR